MLEATILRHVQSATKLSPSQLAGLLGVAPQELDSPSPALMADCARLLGVSLEELFARRAGPAAPLYRTIDGNPPVLEAFSEGGAALAIGGFVRDLRLADELERRAEDVPDWATVRSIPEHSQVPHGAAELAGLVRDRLGLGLEPIPSVWQLARELGVRCAAITPDELPGSITGISWRDPRPILIANLVGGSSAWWATRMTVAHELCHVLFDLPALGLILSGDRQGRLYELYRAVEQRADAFAANLLLPRGAVERRAAGRDPLDAGVVGELSAEYHVSTLVAVNLVRHAFNLSLRQRNQLLSAVEGHNVLPGPHPDAVVPGSPRKQLLKTVEGAVEAGALDPVRARTLLGLRMSDPLPFGPEVLAAPVLNVSQRIRGVVAQHVFRRGLAHLAAGETIVRPDGGYEVRLADATTGEETAERLLLSRDLAVVDAQP